MAESKPKPAAPSPGKPGAEGTHNAEALAHEALSQAQASVHEIRAAAEGLSPQPLPLPDFAAGAGADAPSNLELLGDVDLHVTIELGRTRMLVEDVLRLGEGSVVELDKPA